MAIIESSFGASIAFNTQVRNALKPALVRGSEELHRTHSRRKKSFDSTDEALTKKSDLEAAFKRQNTALPRHTVWTTKKRSNTTDLSKVQTVVV